MIFDWDDLYPGNDRLDLFAKLKDANPGFRCTVFAVPGLGNDGYWDSLPDWMELAVHGWLHPHPREAEHWTRAQIEWVLDRKPARMVEGWKSPGWQISDATYEVLLERGWWVADHPESANRRPNGIRYHELGQGNHWHGHIQDVCGNGLAETFDTVLELVRNADSFELISEVAQPAFVPPPEFSAMFDHPPVSITETTYDPPESAARVIQEAATMEFGSAGTR